MKRFVLFVRLKATDDLEYWYRWGKYMTWRRAKQAFCSLPKINNDVYSILPMGKIVDIGGNGVSFISSD